MSSNVRTYSWAMPGSLSFLFKFKFFQDFGHLPSDDFRVIVLLWPFNPCFLTECIDKLGHKEMTRFLSPVTSF